MIDTQPVATHKVKPTHYKVVCISLYTRDIEDLNRLVVEMKARGFTKASKSGLIRMALANLDLDAALAKERLP